MMDKFFGDLPASHLPHAGKVFLQPDPHQVSDLCLKRLWDAGLFSGECGFKDLFDQKSFLIDTQDGRVLFYTEHMFVWDMSFLFEGRLFPWGSFEWTHFYKAKTLDSLCTKAHNIHRHKIHRHKATKSQREVNLQAFKTLLLQHPRNEAPSSSYLDMMRLSWGDPFDFCRVLEAALDYADCYVPVTMMDKYLANNYIAEIYLYPKRESRMRFCMPDDKDMKDWVKAARPLLNAIYDGFGLSMWPVPSVLHRGRYGHYWKKRRASFTRSCGALSSHVVIERALRLGKIAEELEEKGAPPSLLNHLRNPPLFKP